MQQRIIAISLVALLAACSNGQDSQGQAAAQAPASTAPAQAAIESCPEEFYYPFPVDGIRFGFPFHLKSDRISETEAGKARATVILEYLDGTADTVWTGVAGALQAAGYKAVGEAKDVGGGKRQQSFSLKGKPNLLVAVSDAPALLENSTHPGAKGVVWISWPVASHEN